MIKVLCRVFNHKFLFQRWHPKKHDIAVMVCKRCGKKEYDQNYTKLRRRLFGIP